MLTLARKNIRSALIAAALIRSKGFGRGITLWLLLRIALARGHRKLARRLNGNRLLDTVNAVRLHGAYPATSEPYDGYFCIIVMPGTLHFLIPCLTLLPQGLQVVLVANGARRWELAALRRRFPRYPICRLVALPWSSLSHGQVLTLLLHTAPRNFGVLDHDFYVLDPALFNGLAPTGNECATAAFGGESDDGLPYPETYFLFFRASAMQDLMRQYRIDARIYHKIPRRVDERLSRGRPGPVLPLKRYQVYFDTLHVLFLLALSDGYTFRFHPAATLESVAHVGGTSSGAPQTKSLLSCLLAWSFLELVGDPELTDRYAPALGRFNSAAEVKSRIARTTENVARMERIDDIAARLRDALASNTRTTAAIGSRFESQPNYPTQG